MRGERHLLLLGDYLLRRACRQLPAGVREERYREWAAELPAILHDPQVRPAPRRAARMLGYAADTLRGAAMTPVRGRHRARGPTALTSLLYLVLAGELVAVALGIWSTVQAPGHGPNYVQLTWALLLVAWTVSMLARSAQRTSMLIFISGSLVGLAANLWNAALAPRDWVNYLLVANLSISLLAVWLVIRWARARRA